MANFFESGFTVLQELAKLKEKEKKQKLTEQKTEEKIKKKNKCNFSLNLLS
jgi:hypothetical protein